jgi:hypothetical protein
MKNRENFKFGTGIFLISIQILSYILNHSNFPKFDNHIDTAVAWSSYLGKLLGYNFLGIIGIILILKTRKKRTLKIDPNEDQIQNEKEKLDDTIETNEKIIDKEIIVNQDAETELNETSSSRSYIFKFQKSFTLAQKVILSITAFSILLIISYSYAENIDQQNSIKETWFIWTGFILIEAWIQNKIWNSSLNLQLSLKTPAFNKIQIHFKNYKLRVYRILSLLTLMVLATFIIFYYNKIAQHESEVSHMQQEITQRNEQLEMDKTRMEDEINTLKSQLDEEKVRTKALVKSIINSSSTKSANKTSSDVTYIVVSSLKEKNGLYAKGITTWILCISDVIKVINYNEEVEYSLKESARNCQGNTEISVEKYKNFIDASKSREFRINTYSNLGSVFHIYTNSNGGYFSY